VHPRVGPTGKAYRLDMTDEMLDLAEQNKRKSGLTNFTSMGVVTYSIWTMLVGRRLIQTT
jgi:hypothetical protein